MAHESQLDRANENLKLSHDGPGQRQESCTNQRMQAFHQGIESEA